MRRSVLGWSPGALGASLVAPMMTWDSARANGDFDNAGYSYPAEKMPAPGLFVSGG
ncbi:hypothetical protein ABT095_19360 [Kitasatospora sp. NPDC002227]|uniref:hypothetical protein n=1 Tax=Kitasatospora sp. NPDC002227 TaxID=3154773 RepID=UPI00332A807C